MTREEAIKQLDTMWKMLISEHDEIPDSFVLAYSMAVDALKGQLSREDATKDTINEDIISRQAAIDT